MGLRVLQIGNLGPSHSTENELARALLDIGADVLSVQENEPQVFTRVPALAEQHRADFVLWTRTGWDPPVPKDEQLVAQAALRTLGIPTVGYHLDLWWGLNREHQIHDEPYFGVDLLVTADGGHDDAWRAAGIRHAWLPPGISRFECVPGRVRPRYQADVTFVGSYKPGRYHEESTHRAELVAWLRRSYGSRVRFWPRGPAIRGPELRDLYASTRVVVGDSCLVPNVARYWSDRVPESVGRSAFLLHPCVEGIEEHYTDGKHLRLWPAGDWAELRSLIDHYVAQAEERRAIAEAGRAHVLETATYSVRMRQLLAILCDEGVLCTEDVAA